MSAPTRIPKQFAQWIESQGYYIPLSSGVIWDAMSEEPIVRVVRNGEPQWVRGQVKPMFRKLP